MNYFDIIVGLILILAIVKGAKNGFIIELASLMALILGVLGAVFLSSWAEEFLRRWWDSKYLGAIAFLLTFLGIIIGVHMLAKLVDQMIKFAALNILNRIAGAVFSLVKYAFILSVLLAVLEYFQWDSSIVPQSQKSTSKLYTPVSKFAPSIFPYLKFKTDIRKVLPHTDSTPV